MNAILSNLQNIIARTQNRVPHNLKDHALMNFPKSHLMKLKITDIKTSSIPMNIVNGILAMTRLMIPYQDAGSMNI